MGIIVALTDDQITIANGHGRMRTRANRKIRRHDNKTPGLDGLTVDAIGVAGEMAASIVTGIEWTGMFIPSSKLKEWSKKPQPDLGTDVEVRTTTKPTYRLMAHKNDPSEWRFVLVRRMAEYEFDVVGWQYGYEIKQERYWNPTLHYPAYTYPTKKLLPIGDLK